jgi:hypothetical protein
MMTITQDLITYDRSAKQYNVIHPETGEILDRFPAGHKGEAFRYLVSLFAPDLFQAAQRVTERHPQLERVTWRAVEIVINHGVDILTPPVNNALAMVDSSDGYGRYAITSDAGYISCQCDHFQSFAAPITDSGRRVCKHVAAYQLAMYTEERF